MNIEGELDAKKPVQVTLNRYLFRRQQDAENNTYRKREMANGFFNVVTPVQLY